MDTSRISPTAHYTGAVWAKNDLSHPALSAALKPWLHTLAYPVFWALRPLGGGLTLDDVLLQRHRALDGLLSRAIEQQGVRQIVEIAAGLSARGLRFSQRYEGLRYIEGDLPEMAERKRQALDGAGLRGPLHEVRVINALLDEGPQSLSAVAQDLDPSLPIGFVTEGLLPYLSREQGEGLWARVSQVMTRFPKGVYVFDVLTRDSNTEFPAVGAFYSVLGTFVRGAIQPHYDTPQDAIAALKACGYDRVAIHSAKDLPDAKPVGTGDLQRFGEVWRGV